MSPDITPLVAFMLGAAFGVCVVVAAAFLTMALEKR